MSSSLAECPCCGERDLTPLGQLPDSHWFAGKRLMRPIPGGTLFRCPRCYLKFRSPIGDAGRYDALYDNESIETWPADQSRVDWGLIAAQVRRRFPYGARVLDFGCYTGGLLALLGASYDRHGIEINRAAAAAASERTQGPIWASVRDIPEGLRFDVVILADVIEHVKNPLDLITTLGDLLADDGIMIITTGDADNFLWNLFGANWWYCFYPEHIAFVSKRWFEYLSSVSKFRLDAHTKFRYHHQGWLHRIMGASFALTYGMFPVQFLGLVTQLKRIAGRPDVSSVPGNGVSADHQLAVLTLEKTET